ncbi:SEL1-like repeat protein [Pseudomonas sp. GM55]|uniref:SEL1-like repeat protein n=1 Tax=Pseudomonas sp. GM55 TaxID=1144333 RepID=UPI000270B748|nr:sel1 repeat family protein [Pseudomonas sp. GM55]EJM68611.1 Sel1 repeat protein [Pseudomonas sp. GM55]
MLIRAVFLSFLLAGPGACKKEENLDITDDHMAYALGNLQFVCVKESEHLPPVSESAQNLYDYALFLHSGFGKKDYELIARFYRLAYAAGSYKAGTNLHTLISQGLIKSDHPGREVIDIVEELIAAGVPGGYYDMGHYLELGFGVKQDTSRAHAYFRRAADLGNPDAQFYVSKLLEGIRSAKQVVLDMRRCAMNQGHAQSAFNYGIFLKVRHSYPEAIEGFQAGARNGHGISAGFLSGGFATPDPKDRLYYFALTEDPERSRRYKKINEFLRRYEDFGARVPDIDNIVPLPPAKLPDWDGTFEWLKKRDSTPPPERPSEEMIRELSQEKGLDPETGLPLSKHQ